MKKILVFLIFAICISCSSVNIAEVKKYSWKNSNEVIIFSRGKPLDVLEFTGTTTNGVYVNNKGRCFSDGELFGTIKSGNSDELIIMTLKNETASYVSFAKAYRVDQ